MDLIVPIVAAVVSVGTLILSAISTSRKVAKEDFEALKARIILLEHDLEKLQEKVNKCEQERDAYMRENLELTRQLAHVNSRERLE